MKATTRMFLINLAWIGLLVGAQPVAAQEGPPPGKAPAGPQSPFVPESGGEQLGPEVPATPPVEELSDSVVDEGESLLVQEPVDLDGGTFGDYPVGPCCAVCGGGACCPPNWYLDQGVRFLTRERARRIPLTFVDEFIGFDTDGNPVFTPSPVMTTRSPGFDFAAGYAATVGYYLGRDAVNRDQFLEFSYWGLNDWRESRAVTGERLTDSVNFAPNVVTFGSLNSGFDPTTGATSPSFPFFGTPSTTFNSRVNHSAALPVGGFNRADEQWAFYQSDIHNFELNLRFRPRGGRDRLVLHPNGRWRRECRPGRYISYLFGVRVMSVEEGFDWHSRGSFEVNGAPFSTVSGDYLVRTYNDLVGLQIGADLTFRNCQWSWGVRTKAGPYINFASQTSRCFNDAAGDPYASVPLDFRTSADKDDAAFIGEVGFIGTYTFRPNLILRASYDFMWVVGLALAPEQIVFETDPPDGINANGLGFYHGLTLGFEWLR